MVPISFVPCATRLVNTGMFNVSPRRICFGVIPSASPGVALNVSLSIFILVLFCDVHRGKVNNFINRLTLGPFGPDGPITGTLLVPMGLVLRLMAFLTHPISLTLQLFNGVCTNRLVFVLVTLLPF